MKRTLLLLIAITILVFLAGCTQENIAKNSKPKGIPVKIEPLKARPFSEYLAVSGTIIPARDVRIVAEEGGTLIQVKKDKGAYASKGDTLAILENKIAENSYLQAKAALKQARLNYDSQKPLFEKKAISEVQFLSTKYAFEQAEAAYNLAKSRYEKLFIKATISGRVNDRYVDPGSFIAPGTPVFEMIDTRSLKARTGIAERFFKDINPGSDVQITLDAFPGLIIKSTVTFKSKKIDPLSRTFIIEAEFKNPDNAIGAGQIANLKVLKQVYDSAIIIPQDAIMESENGDYVFIDSSHTARIRRINVASVYEDQMVVNGLNPGESLIVVGQRNVAHGDTIYVVSDTEKE